MAVKIELLKRDRVGALKVLKQQVLQLPHEKRSRLVWDTIPNHALYMVN